VPNADPEAARDIAVKHLFRHLRDDQALLRNPLVGPDLLSGKFTAQELRAGVARAATIIRDEDARLGRSERGKRQATCLMQCDLGSRSVASLAGEFAISPRQLARERHEAWMRTLPHILVKTAHLTSLSINDVVHNRALGLFRVGRFGDATEVMRKHIATCAPEAAMYGLCSLALMQHDARRSHEAKQTYQELRVRVPMAAPTLAHSRLNLALHLLAVLLGQTGKARFWTMQVRDLVRRAAVEASAAPWMSRTILRLLFSLSQKFVYADDFQNILGVSCAIDEIVPSFDDLDCHEAFSLHSLKAIGEWKQNGFTVDMEAHMLRVLHLAISNGWTGVVAEGASLLASVYYLSGSIAAARDYRDVALSGIALTDDRGATALAYNNLAIAALDSGCVAAAAQFGGQYRTGTLEEDPLLKPLALTTAEILIRQGHATQGTAQARDVLRRANTSGNQRLLAIAGRVVALGMETAGDSRGAIAALKESVDLAGAGCCSKFDVHRIESSYRKIARLKQLTTRELEYQHFCG
jgi:hypothetical protein